MCTAPSRILLILLIAALAGCSSTGKSSPAPARQAGRQPSKHVKPSKRPIAEQTVDLKFIEVPENTLGCNYRLHGGKISSPFPNTAGKLTIEVRDGKVYGDTNGDGVIDAKDAPPVEPTKGILKFDMNMPGGQVVAFPVRVGQYRKLGGSSEDPFLELSWLGALQADAGDWTIRYSALSFEATPEKMFSNVAIRPAGSDARSPSYRAASQTYCIGERLYNVKLSADLTKLTISPYTGEVAEVRFSYQLGGDAAPAAKVPWSREDRSGIFLVHRQGLQQAEARSGTIAKFVPGEYDARSVFLSRPISDGEHAYVSARMDAHGPPLTLKPGINEISVGAPFRMDFVATRNGGQIELADVMLTGKLGEKYSPPGQGGKSEFALYLLSGGKEKQLAKLEYG